MKIASSIFFVLVITLNFKSSILSIFDLLNNSFLVLFKDTIYDYTNFLISISLIYVYSFKVYLLNFYLYLLSPRNAKITISIRRPYLWKPVGTKNVKSINLNFSNSVNFTIPNQYLLTMHSLFKIKNNLFWINFPSTLQNLSLNVNTYVYSLNNKFLVSLDSKPKNVSYRFNLKDLSKSYLKSNYYNRNDSTSINCTNPTLTKKNFFNSSLIENILNESMNVLKQSRWLSRNLMLSDRFITSTNYFTEYKKLIGNNVATSKLANNNVWASSNLSKINSKNVSSIFTNYKNSFYNSYILDKFDDSRLWLFKKIYYNTILRYSDTILNYRFNKKVLHAPSYFKDKSYLELTKSSLPYNLLLLDNSIKYSDNTIRSNNNQTSGLNFVYNVHDYNLLTDENLDNLVNLFVNSSLDNDTFYFYSNLDSFAYSDVNLDYLSFKYKNK